MQKSPTTDAKETYYKDKRAPTTDAKKTYYRGERAPTTDAKETYYRGERAPTTDEKQPYYRGKMRPGKFWDALDDDKDNKLELRKLGDCPQRAQNAQGTQG
jgi:hypothetical protein